MKPSQSPLQGKSQWTGTVGQCLDPQIHEGSFPSGMAWATLSPLDQYSYQDWLTGSNPGDSFSKSESIEGWKR